MTTITKQLKVETAITVLSCLRPNVSPHKDDSNRKSDSVTFRKAEEKYSDRLKPSLDALAKICISDAHSQVIATTISITASHVQLFVSTNTEGTLYPSLANYLKSIWASLKDISHSHFNAQSPPESSPPPEVDAINTLAVVVYKHCQAKVLQIIKKRFDQFEHFSAFTNQLGDNTPQFFDVVEAIIVGLNDMDSMILTEAIFNSLVRALNETYMDLQEPLKDEKLSQNHYTPNMYCGKVT